MEILFRYLIILLRLQLSVISKLVFAMQRTVLVGSVRISLKRMMNYSSNMSLSLLWERMKGCRIMSFSDDMKIDGRINHFRTAHPPHHFSFHCSSKASNLVKLRRRPFKYLHFSWPLKSTIQMQLYLNQSQCSSTHNQYDNHFENIIRQNRVQE